MEFGEWRISAHQKRRLLEETSQKIQPEEKDEKEAKKRGCDRSLNELGGTKVECMRVGKSSTYCYYNIW